jgi:hypothetical protein
MRSTVANPQNSTSWEPGHDSHSPLQDRRRSADPLRLHAIRFGRLEIDFRVKRLRVFIPLDLALQRFDGKISGRMTGFSRLLTGVSHFDSPVDDY